MTTLPLMPTNPNDPRIWKAMLFCLCVVTACFCFLFYKANQDDGVKERYDKMQHFNDSLVKANYELRLQKDSLDSLSAFWESKSPIIIEHYKKSYEYIKGATADELDSLILANI